MKSIFFATFIALLSVAWLMANSETDPDIEEKKELRKIMKIKVLNRKKIRLELNELAKKQAKDEEFQKLLNTINDNRKQFEWEEKPIPKGISELNANLDDTFQFDIMLNEEQSEQILTLTTIVDAVKKNASESSGKSSRRRRGASINAAHDTTAKWPNAVVPYMFAADVSTEERTLIRKAMDIWQQKTCVTFQLNSAAFNKLYFTTAYAGCWSYVGRQSSWAQQEVSIGYGCDYVGIIAHEIGHALGFWHEQSRHDRDNWVIYNAANVRPGHESNFNKYTTITNNNYGHRYDYGSLMHYAEKAFSSNDQPVLIAKNAKWQRTMGQRLGPSFYDFKVMNSHYQCQSRCAIRITCQNGGIQNSRLCSECICPPGIGGPTCGLVNPAPINAGYAPPGVPNTCNGTTVKALATAQELSGQIGSISTSWQMAKSDYAWCHWSISAEPGYKIAIEVLDVGNYCATGCYYGNMEIRVWDANDWGRTGYRLCCTSDISQVGSITTPGTRAMISLYSSKDVQRFRIRFWQIRGNG